MNPKIIAFVIFFYYSIASVSSNIKNSVGDYNAKIYFFNIGQGDSALLVTKTGKRVLIDGGPDFTVEKDLLDLVLFPVCNLDVVLVTHAHADHLMGITDVLKKCNVNELMFNDVDYPSKLYTDFLSDIEKNKNIKKINSHIISGNKFNIDDITFYILWPNDLVLKNFKDLNQTSIVVLIDSGNSEVLMTGDAEGVSLNQIDFASYKNVIDNGLDILKVPHHGAKAGFSASLFNQFPPTYCIISVGINSYGHPSPQAITDMEKYHCNIMRTDQKGTIEFGLN